MVRAPGSVLTFSRNVYLSRSSSRMTEMLPSPFEVPQCPEELLNTRFRVVHDEGHDTWTSWKDRDRQYGEVHWGVMPGFEKTIAAEKFLDARGEVVRVCRRVHQSTDKPWVGYWWLWPSPIVFPP